jgi:hypothetical protein
MPLALWMKDGSMYVQQEPEVRRLLVGAMMQEAAQPVERVAAPWPSRRSFNREFLFVR